MIRGTNILMKFISRANNWHYWDTIFAVFSKRSKLFRSLIIHLFSSVSLTSVTDSYTFEIIIYYLDSSRFSVFVSASARVYAREKERSHKLFIKNNCDSRICSSKCDKLRGFILRKCYGKNSMYVSPLPLMS